MDSRETILLVVVIIAILIAAKMIYDGASRKKKLFQKIKKAYGKLPETIIPLPGTVTTGSDIITKIKVMIRR